MSQADRQRKTSEEVALGFRGGHPKDVAAVTTRVTRILAFRGFGMSDADRQDIRQEVLAQLWGIASRSDFDHTAGFWSLVETITIRRSIDWLRRRRPEEPLDVPVPDRRPDPVDVTLAREKLEMVRRVQSTLREECRHLIRLRIGESLSFRDISQRLGDTEGALRVRFHRCVVQMREMLRSEYATSSPGGSARRQPEISDERVTQRD